VTDIRRVLLLAPMTSELRPLVRISRSRRADRDGLRSFTGRVGDLDVVMVRLGVGPVMARAVTTRALSAFPVDHVIVSGIAGGLDPDLGVGSVVVPESVVDLASGERFRSHPLPDIVSEGTVGVSDRLITDTGRLSKLQAEGIVALEMESSGVAEACQQARVPWTTIRVIGDRPDEGLTDATVMSFLRPDGTVDSLAAIRFLVSHPQRIPGLLRLGRDSANAAAKAARFTLKTLERTS
jgi:adenosylhomocysteine nucleosidase